MRRITQVISTDTALAVAFANSGRDGSMSPDRLRTAGGLASWLSEAGLGSGGVAEEMALRLGEFVALRGAIRGLLGAAVARVTAPAATVEGVNDASARVPLVARLETRGGEPRAVLDATRTGATAAVLAALARSAIGLVGGDDRGQLHLCEAPGCGSFFLASRRTQAWCSNACGNRARVSRHYARARSRDR